MKSEIITIVPKDSIHQARDLEVVLWYHSHGAFTFVSPDGSTRVIPDVHVWEVKSKAPWAI